MGTNQRSNCKKNTVGAACRPHPLPPSSPLGLARSNEGCISCQIEKPITVNFATRLESQGPTVCIGILPVYSVTLAISCNAPS